MLATLGDRLHFRRWRRWLAAWVLAVAAAAVSWMSAPPVFLTAQEKSVRPGINDSFRRPDLQKYLKTFEGESREIAAKRKEIVAACGVRPGMHVADIGAGTGLFTRLFAREVGPDGKVYAVDISDTFLDYIATTSREQGLANVVTVKGTDHSPNLPEGNIDLAFICDTYHHFEFPLRMMTQIHKALKPGGRVVLIDFHRIPGKSSEWILNHVRAGQEVFEREIAECGFKKVHEDRQIGLKENYFVVFEKIERK